MTTPQTPETTAGQAPGARADGGDAGIGSDDGALLPVDALGATGVRPSLANWVYGASTVGAFAFLFYFPYFAYLQLGNGRALTTYMATALTWAVAAMALNLVAGYTGMLSLGHAAFMAAGALVMVKLGGVMFAPEVAFFVAIIWGFAMGALVAVFCAHLKGFYLSVVTFLAAGVVPFVTELFLDIFSGHTDLTPVERIGFASTVGLKPGDVVLGFKASEAYDKPFYEFLVVPLVLLVFLLTWALVRSGLGRAWMAIRDSEIAAKACGVPVYAYRLLSFSISAAIASVAGVIYSQNPNNSIVDPRQFNYELSFKLVFYCLLGGLGTVGGPLLGAVLVGFGFEALFKAFGVDQRPGAVPITLGTLLIINMVLAPNGIIGLGRDIKRRFDRKGALRGQSPRRPKAPTTTERDRTPKPTHPVDRWGGAPILELRDTSKVFGGLRAVDRVNLAVQPGSIHSLIGPNGSGKTTTINVITGFYTADEGRVLFQGKDVTREQSHRRAHHGMTRTFQNLQVFRNMTVIQNVMVGLQPKIAVMAGFIPGTDADSRARAYGLLQYVGLEHRAFEPAGSLAYAEQRRLEIARALAANPDLVLLDEPAAGMNPAETHDLTDLIRDIRDHGITVLLIEHHMDLVMALSDTITVLDFGTKIAEGTPEQVQSDSRVIEAYLGAGAT